MKCLVVGYGSIGQRHARLLTELGCRTAVISSRSIEFTPHYPNLTDGLTHWQPDYVVVANRTFEHQHAIEILAQQGFQGLVLIEKPLFDHAIPLPPAAFSLAAVAYNLRCHPLICKLKSFINNSAEQVVSASVTAGSYLPDWRPDRDYRHCYSAKKSEGGGVLRDLSHELDYVFWLFGPWKRMTAMGGHISRLEIDSDDSYTLLMETESCRSITIQMSYIDRVPRREILVNTSKHTLRVDLINNIMIINDALETINVTRDDTYRAEHQAMLTGKIDDLCTLEEALETLRTIEVAERAAAMHTWIER